MDWPPDSYGANEGPYEKMIRDAVADYVGGDKSRVEVIWAEVDVEAGGHHGVFYVTAVPIKIDGFYPGMGARVLQQVGDLLGATLAPPRLVDLAYEQAAVRITPVQAYLTQTMHTACDPLAGVKMQSLNCMHVYATTVEAELTAAGYTKGQLVGGFGKYFVLVKGLTSATAANYGFLEKGAGPPYAVTPAAAQTFPFHPIQDVGTKHGLNQNDYSQGGFLVYRYCRVDGKDADVYDVMQDAELAPLVSHEGALPYARQPGVPVYACATKNVTIPPPDGEMCPPPTSPPPTGGSGGAGKVLLYGGIVAAGAAAAYATRRTWLRWLRRIW